MCGWRRGCGVRIQVALSFLASAVLAWLACAFAAVTAVAVTRAALTAFAVVFRPCTTFLRCVGFLPLGGDHSGFGGTGIAGRGVCLAAFTTTLATFTTAFATALTTFTAAFATGCAFIAHFGAIDAQLGLRIAAVFVSAFIAVVAATITTGFTGRTLASRPLCAFTTLRTFAACGTGFAFAQFIATL